MQGYGEIEAVKSHHKSTVRILCEFVFLKTGKDVLLI